jgi:hypothetical protein
LRPLAALLPAALAAALLAGCAGQQTASKNSEDYKGEEQAVAQVIDDLSKAGRDQDGKEVCTALLAPDVADRLKQGAQTCQDIVEDQLSDANVFDLDVKSIKVNGDTATAQVESQFDGKDATRTLRFRKVGTTWRIQSIG